MLSKRRLLLWAIASSTALWTVVWIGSGWIPFGYSHTSSRGPQQFHWEVDVGWGCIIWSSRTFPAQSLLYGPGGWGAGVAGTPTWKWKFVFGGSTTGPYRDR